MACAGGPAALHAPPRGRHRPLPRPNSIFARGDALLVHLRPPRGARPQADPSAALERCAKEMEQYDQCMEKWSKSHSLTYYRVQEEYRKKDVE